MLKTLFTHKYLSLKRSNYFDGTMIAKLVKMLIGLMSVAYGLAIGLFVDLFLKEIAPNMPISESFFYFSVLYFSFVLCCQVFMIKSDVYDVMPYYCLPIKRNVVMALGVLSKTPASFDYFTLFFYLVICLKFAYNGMLTGCDVACYTIMAFFVSILVSTSVRLFKTIGSFLLLIAYVACVLYISYMLFRIDISLIAQILSNRHVALMLIVVLPIVAYIVIRLQYRREFYGTLEGATKTKKVSVSVAGIKNISPYLRFMLLMLMRNRTFIWGVLIFSLMGGMHLLAGLMKGANVYMVPFWSMFLFGGAFAFSNPIIIHLSHYFDGLYVGCPSFVRSLLQQMYKVYLIIGLILAVVFAIVTGKYFLVMALYLFAVGVTGMIGIYGNRYASKRTDYFKSANKGGQLDMRVTLINMSPFIFYILATFGFVYLEEWLFSSIFSIVGLILIGIHRVLIDNTNKAFMKRRYENMAGLRGDK